MNEPGAEQKAVSQALDRLLKVAELLAQVMTRHEFDPPADQPEDRPKEHYNDRQPRSQAD